MAGGLTHEALDRAAGTPVGKHDAAVTRHMAIIGGSGTGKTTWAASADDVLFVLTEAQAKGRIQDKNPNARVVLCGDFDDMKAIIEWLTAAVFVPSNTGWRPRFVALDSVTELGRMIADRIDGGNADGAEWGYKQWKKYEDVTLRMIRRFRDLPGVTVLGLFLDEVTRGEDGALGSRRMKTGKKSMAPSVAALFDLVFWAEVREKGDEAVVYRLRTVGGTYGGNALEQGKGHESLAKWIDPGEMTPTRILDVVAAKHTATAAKAASAKAKAKSDKSKSETTTPATEAPKDGADATGTETGEV